MTIFLFWLEFAGRTADIVAGGIKLFDNSEICRPWFDQPDAPLDPLIRAAQPTSAVISPTAPFSGYVGCP